MYNKQSVCHSLLRQHFQHSYSEKDRFKDFEWSVTRLTLDKKFFVHSGCVNTVCWSSNGHYLLSGSDDRKLAITSPFSHKAESKSFVSGHRANIFSAKFLPHSDDIRVISAAGDGRINLTDLGLVTSSPDADNIRSFACHRATVFDVVTSPTEASVFLSVSADGTVRLFDIREHEPGHTVLLSNQHCKYYGYTAAAVHPLANERLFVADKDGFIGEYDRRCIGYGRWVSKSKPVEVLSSKRLVRVTSLAFDPRASGLLASYNGGTLYLFDISQPVPHSQLARAPDASEDPLHGTVDGAGASAAEGSGRIIFRFRGDWSDTGPESEPPSDRAGPSDYSERLGQFMMRAYQLNRQRNPDRSEAEENQNQAQPEQNEDNPGGDVEVDENHINAENNSRPDPIPPNLDQYHANADDNQNFPYHNQGDPNRNQTEPIRNFVGQEPSHMRQVLDQPESESVQIAREEPYEPAASTPFMANVSGDYQASVSEDMADGTFCTPWSWSKRRPVLADSGSQTEAAADYPSYPVRRVFQGHRNARTCIQQSAFWGSEYVISGSDCGHFLVWRVSDGRLLNACLADQRVVNRVVPHPSLLYLATSGIDYDIKLWSPTRNVVDGETAAADLTGLVRRNQAMLAQTMNTVTVPGSAMLSIMRMLSRLYSRDAQ